MTGLTHACRAAFHAIAVASNLFPALLNQAFVGPSRRLLALGRVLAWHQHSISVAQSQMRIPRACQGCELLLLLLYLA